MPFEWRVEGGEEVTEMGGMSKERFEGSGRGMEKENEGWGSGNGISDGRRKENNGRAVSVPASPRTSGI